MSLPDWLRFAAVMLIWGFNFPISKIGITELPPILMMALRFSLVALLLCPWRRLPPGRLGHILLLSVTFGSVHFPLMFYGLSRIDASLASLLVPMQVPIAAVLAAIVFRDRLTWPLLLGMGVAFAGIVIIAGEPRVGDDWLPVAMILAAAFAWAVANIQVKYLGQIDPFALSGWIAFFATPQLVIMSLLLERNHIAILAAAGWHGYGAVAYNAIAVTIVSYALWYPMMRKYPINLLMPLTLAAPVAAVAASMLVLGESLTAQVAIGGAATLVGVAITTLKRRPEPVR